MLEGGLGPKLLRNKDKKGSTVFAVEPFQSVSDIKIELLSNMLFWEMIRQGVI